MTNIALWNIQAGSNTSAPPAGAPENMLRSAVNDTMREMMAATRRWYGDTQSAQLTTGGPPSNAYLLDSVGRINGAGYALYTDLPLLTFRIHAANTGAVTLNVDGLGTKNFFKAPGSAPFAAGELTAGQVCVVAYNAALGAFELIGPKVARDGFATNVSMIFKMATPPLGWVKSTTDDDSSIRIIGGTAGVPLTTGGTTGVSIVFAPRTILKANIPDYNLDHSTLTFAGVGNHTHPLGDGGFDHVAVGTGQQGGCQVDNASNRFGINSTGTASTISATNGGGAHTPAWLAGATPAFLKSGGSGTPMDFSAKYVDVVVAVRT